MKKNTTAIIDQVRPILFDQITLVESTFESLHKNDVSFCVKQGVVGSICQKGSAIALINNTSVNIKAGEIYGITPDQTFSFKHISDDFACTAIFVPQSLISEFKQSMNQKYVLGALTHRTFLMPQNVADDLTSLTALIRKHMEIVDGRLQTTNEVEQAIVLSILDSMILISNTAVPSRMGSKNNLSRQESITRHFFSNLMKHYKSHHNVEFYAELECVSAKYLSTVVRMVTEKPVQDWINMIVIFAAKRMLKNSEASIADVAKELNFSSASSFIRYFRNATGETPRVYRFKE